MIMIESVIKGIEDFIGDNIIFITITGEKFENPLFEKVKLLFKSNVVFSTGIK